MENVHENNENLKKDYTPSDDAPFGKSDQGLAPDFTTGSGYSEAERQAEDAVNTDYPEEKHKGSRELIDRYNINDQAHSDSSKDDFVKTISNSTHADGRDASED